MADDALPGEIWLYELCICLDHKNTFLSGNCVQLVALQLFWLPAGCPDLKNKSGIDIFGIFTCIKILEKLNKKCLGVYFALSQFSQEWH